MIRKMLLLLVISCLAAPPAMAGIWLFGGKKENTPAGQAQESPQIFRKLTPKPGTESKLFEEAPVAQNKPVVIDGDVYANLTPQMLTSSYTPKTVEEIQAISKAHQAWKNVELVKMEKESEQGAQKIMRENEMFSTNMRLAGMKQQYAGRAVGRSGALPQSKPTKAIYNNWTAPVPGKIFKNYR